MRIEDTQSMSAASHRRCQHAENGQNCTKLATWGDPARRVRPHPGGNPGANLKSISHRCHLFEVAFVWELTKEPIHLPLGCLQGGVQSPIFFVTASCICPSLHLSVDVSELGFPLLLDPRQKSRVERLKAKVEPLLT